jgi:aspartate kinase
MIKVCKFGGTSLSNAENIKRVAAIVKDDCSRKYVVVSAPGKRFKSDIKITDLLYNTVEAALKHKDPSAALKIFAGVEKRFTDIICELGLPDKFKKEAEVEFEALKELISSNAEAVKRREDYIVSRGEYFIAKILAAVLSFGFIDACEIILFEGQTFLAEETNETAKKKLSSASASVVPGFYGKDRLSGEVRVFSRGGGDISGAIVARAVKCSVYENFTDVDGFLSCDPALVGDPPLISKLSYKELRELSYMGANVLHPESIFPVRIENIPINIKNTFNPDFAGTLILPSNLYEKETVSVTGIAGKQNYDIIHIEKSMLNNEKGVARKILSVLNDNDISFEHMPSGIDSISIVIAQSEIKDKADKVLSEIRAAVAPSILEYIKGISLVAVVGTAIGTLPSTALRIFTALQKAGITTRLINQSSSQMNIILGVENKDYKAAISALYNEFFKPA